MRTTALLLPVLALVSLASPAARACGPFLAPCRPAVTRFAAFTPEGIRVGTVEARVRPALPLERSRFTGQPIGVVFNNPASLPGSVDPELELVPLPRVPHFHTQGAYPRGY